MPPGVGEGQVAGARPIFHHLKDSINAHLAIVMAALAVSKWIESSTGWAIRKFVKTARRYKAITIQAGDRTITAADPVACHGEGTSWRYFLPLGF